MKKMRLTGLLIEYILKCIFVKTIIICVTRASISRNLGCLFYNIFIREG